MPTGIYKRNKKQIEMLKNQGFQKGNHNVAKRIDVRRKISLANKEKNKGKKSWMYGKKGKNCPNWKGGKQRNKHNGNIRYKEWRMSVFLRDNFTCQFCGLRSNIGLGKSVYLEGHHIKSWSKYPKLRFEVNNGITLCKECHNLTSQLKVGQLPLT